MPRGRNFMRRTYKCASNRIGVIKAVTIVTPEKAHPFVCPVCKMRDDEKEYLRIYPTKVHACVCVHSDCLIEMLHKKKELLDRGILYTPACRHGRHEGMRATGMKDA